MKSLRSYTREALLALPADAELDALVHGVMGRQGHAPQYSKDVMLVGVMLVKLREHWHHYALGPFGENFVIANDPIDSYIEFKELPHVCALALVLAAREKERNP